MDRFGIEIEGVTPLSQTRIRELLEEEGLPCRIHSRNMTSQAPNAWLITTDRSIQKVPQGKGLGDEIVSPVLDYNLDSFEVIKRVCKVLKLAEFSINKSCALHVHASIEGLSREQIKSIFELYKTLEPELNKMFSKSRKENNTRQITDRAEKELKGGREFDSYCQVLKDLTWEQFAGPNRPHYTKYYSVRLCSQIPTMEFRVHQGTLNSNKIIKWIQIINKIIETGKLGEKVLADRYGRIRENDLAGVLHDILGDRLYTYFAQRCKEIND